MSYWRKRQKSKKNPNISIHGEEEEDKVVLCSPKDAVNFLNLKASISFSTFQYLTENKKGSSAERESLLWMWFIACWKSNLRYFGMTSRFNELEWSGRQRKVRSSHLWDRVDPRGPNSSSPQTSWGPDVAWNINSFSGYFDFPGLMFKKNKKTWGYPQLYCLETFWRQWEMKRSKIWYNEKKI